MTVVGTGLSARANTHGTADHGKEFHCTRVSKEISDAFEIVGINRAAGSFVSGHVGKDGHSAMESRGAFSTLKWY